VAKASDDGFEALAGYDGYEFVFESGFVARFEIRQRKEAPRSGQAHSYKYSFTLHRPGGKRVLGFDNAHAVSIKSGKRRKRSPAEDHWHRNEHDKGRPYNFVSPHQLLGDFMSEVERVLRATGVSTEILDMRRSP
jgi:Family of unknown function (DUF6516)